MFYDPRKHHRKSIRLKGYDYSWPGFYFVTPCVQNRLCLFGEIIAKQMLLNDAGQMIERWYRELENKYPHVRCREMVVMPNHMHFIIEITDESVSTNPVGANLCVRPDENATTGRHIDQPLPGKRESLSTIIQWFKTMTTNEYICGVKNNDWPRFNKKLWQRNFYEHIIRNEQSYQHIANYIINNPANWEDDKLR